MKTAKQGFIDRIMLKEFPEVTINLAGNIEPELE